MAPRGVMAGMHLRGTTLTLAVLLLGGCGSLAPAANGTLTGEWQLTDGTHDGAPLPLVDEAPITFAIVDGEATGRAACNAYSGTATIDGEGLAIGAMSTTEMGCEPAVMELESAYLAALRGISGWERAGDVLTLSGEGVELRYELVPPPADAALDGTAWTLDGLVNGEAVSSTMGGPPPTLVLDQDGTLSGTTGCRTFQGRYEVSGDRVSVSDLANDDRACPELAGQDEHVLAVIGEGFAFRIEGNRLTLDAGDLGLVYLAAGE